MGELDGKVAIVTGAGRLRGIGRAAAVSLAKLGADVVVTGTGRKPENYPDDEKAIGWRDIESVADLVRAEGRRALPLVADVTNRDHVKNMIDQTIKELGRIDILINNAANDDRHSTNQVDEKYWNNRMDVNLKHFFFTIKSVLNGMIKNKSGSIVNLSSVSWMMGEGDKVAYETAKSAVIGLTRSFAREFGKYNIRCNSVTPGSIATERQIKHWLTPKYKKFILDKQCLKRQLKPSDVANLVLYLSSDVSSGCTKQNFIVDAGIT